MVIFHSYVKLPEGNPFEWENDHEPLELEVAYFPTNSHHHLVGGFKPYPFEKYDESSVGMMTFPTFYGKSFKIPWFQSPPTSEVPFCRNNFGCAETNKLALKRLKRLVKSTVSSCFGLQRFPEGPLSRIYNWYSLLIG